MPRGHSTKSQSKSRSAGKSKRGKSPAASRQKNASGRTSARGQSQRSNQSSRRSQNGGNRGPQQAFDQDEAEENRISGTTSRDHLEAEDVADEGASDEPLYKRRTVKSTSQGRNRARRSGSGAGSTRE